MRKRGYLIIILVVIGEIIYLWASIIEKEDIQWGKRYSIKEEQWYMQSGMGLDMEKTWNYMKKVKKKHKKVIVALLDTGVDYTHCELQGKIWENVKEIKGDGIDNDNNGYLDDIYGWDFVNESGSWNHKEMVDHGTQCAGIIAAKGKNGMRGITGEENVEIMSLKVMEQDKKEISISKVIRAIHYAEAHGAKICNISLTLSVNSKLLSNAIKASKMLFVVAAGNNNSDLKKNPIYPASYKYRNVITVGSMDRKGDFGKLSNYGKEMVDIIAPGTEIYSTISENQYGTSSGTSFSAPMVSGVSAMLYLKGGYAADEIRSIIIKTAKKNNHLVNKVKKGSVLNPYAACSYE